MSATMPIDAGPAWYNTREYLTGRPLTPLEFRALHLAGHGLSDAEIGARLGCSENMAGQAIHRAAWKLGTRGRAGAVAQGYLRGLLKPPPQAEETVRLPRREAQILRLYAEGLTDDQIADRLGIKLRTVHSYGKRLRKRLGARDRAHAVRRSLETRAICLVPKHAGDDHLEAADAWTAFYPAGSLGPYPEQPTRRGRLCTSASARRRLHAAIDALLDEAADSRP